MAKSSDGEFSDPFKNAGCFFRTFGQLAYLCIAAVSCCKTFDPPLKLELNPFLGRETIKKVVLPSQLWACFSHRQLMALLSAVLCSTGHSFFGRTPPTLGASLWLLWLSLSSGSVCLPRLCSLLFTGRLAGWGPHNNKALTLNFPLSVGIWLWACVEHASEWLVRESWVCWGWGGDPPVGWNEEKESVLGFCSFVVGWGSVSGENPRQTDGGLCSCVAPSTLSGP